MIVAASSEPELIEYAKQQGRQGHQPGRHLLHGQRDAHAPGHPAGRQLPCTRSWPSLTGAVEAMVVDVQCIMQALVRPGRPSSTPSSSPRRPRRRSRAPTAHRVRRAPCAMTGAKQIVRRGHRQLPQPRRDRPIPDDHADRRSVIAGFSHEYINYMQGGTLPRLVPAAQRRHQSRAHPRRGRRRGLQQPARHAGLLAHVQVVAGAAQERRAGGRRPAAPPPALPSTATCAGEAHGTCRAGAARGLRGHRHPAGAAHGLVRGQHAHPDGAHRRWPTEGGLGEDISDLPAVGLCPEWMCEKALAIGIVLRGLGRLRHLRRCLRPSAGSPEVVDIMLNGWDEAVRRRASSSSPTPTRSSRSTLAHIDKKRAALGLPEYEPAQFGEQRRRASWTICSKKSDEA